MGTRDNMCKEAFGEFQLISLSSNSSELLFDDGRPLGLISVQYQPNVSQTDADFLASAQYA